MTDLATVTAPASCNGSVIEAIRKAVEAAGLAYSFSAGAYTMASLNAALAVEEVYRRETAADDKLGVWRPLAEAANKVLAQLEMDQFARETLK